MPLSKMYKKLKSDHWGQGRGKREGGEGAYLYINVLSGFEAAEGFVDDCC